MKRLFALVLGLALVTLATGCCCNPCGGCGYGCGYGGATYGGGGCGPGGCGVGAPTGFLPPACGCGPY